MSIKCSLLGHRFGETTVERDREEDGTEVVITITELETCTRCGETRVVSENKEVTTLETPAEGDAGEESAAGSGSTVGVDADAAAGGTDAEFVDSGDRSGAATDAGGSGPPIPDAESETAGGVDAGDDDDAVIIGDDAGDASDEDGDERESGDWPEEAADKSGRESPAEGGHTVDDAGDDASDEASDADGERGHGEWPDEPEGVDAAERAGESAEVEILGDGTDDESDDESTVESASESAGGDASAGSTGDESTGDESVGAGSVGAGHASAADDDDDAVSTAAGGDDADWPEESGDIQETPGDMGDWPAETKRDEPAESSVTPSLGDDDAPAITVPEGMFKCSECGFTTEVESSSLRAGDFCPECHRGTLVQDAGADADPA